MLGRGSRHALTCVVLFSVLLVGFARPVRHQKQIAPGTIVTVAGTGLPSGFGDGRLATRSALCKPAGVAVDAQGNLIIADTYGHRIVRVDSGGILTRIAGTGQPGFSGDGGPAALAAFNIPYDLEIGPDGSIYVSDHANLRVRRISPSGVVETVAAGQSGPASGDGGPATMARIGAPVGIGLDRKGNLYIADQGNHRIRKVNINGIITTVVGTGQQGYWDGVPAVHAHLNGPRDVCLARDGSMYIADEYNHRVRKVDPRGIISTVAGTGQPGFSGDGGPAIEARVHNPVRVTLDDNGNLYISDWANSCIRMVDKQGIIRTVAGTAGVAGFNGDGGLATEALLNLPREIAFSGDRMYIADMDNYRVRMVKLPVPLAKPKPPAWERTPSPGAIETVVGNGLVGAFGMGLHGPRCSLSNPLGLATDDEGNLYIADSMNHRILMLDTAGMVGTFCGLGRSESSGDEGPAWAATFNHPADVCRDAAGNFYISEYDGCRVRKIDASGTIHAFAGTGEPGFSGDGGSAVAARLNHPVGVAVDKQGRVYIADRNNHRVRRVDKNGRIATVVGTGSAGYNGDGIPARHAELNAPRELTFDARGNLYITEDDGHRVRRVDRRGIISTVAGNGRPEFSGDGGRAIAAGLCSPRAVAVDQAGNIYIADALNNCVRQIRPDGTIATIAGIAGIEGFLGDGGRADRALLRLPQGLALHGNYLYITDTLNARIRRVTLSTSNP